MLLSVNDLAVSFDGALRAGRAVDTVSFTIEKGRTLGLVGSSGSGKSVTCHAILDLLPPTAERLSGTAVFDGQDLFALDEGAMAACRGRRIAMIFQDPVRSLNPVMTIGAQLGETLRLHRGLSGPALTGEIKALLRLVGIPDPALRSRAYPHQLSGGMCQRVMIAMATAARPDLLIADEPTTALDLTTQAQILSLLRDLQEHFGTAILLVSHDVSVVAELAHRVAVMSQGRIVEEGAMASVLRDPRHPVTQEIVADAMRLPIPEALTAPDLGNADLRPPGQGSP
ncbi:ABC transporter ATP-binding protein [Pelagibius sp.]|uniref:ATP-binding cassette domain-containing protein n=1 Tax=Pelagibius sp. TaxID=1931238 RepID=UPI002627E27B|nr:ABC transporter ATP-binding protein [Pelagibius sp.]